VVEFGGLAWLILKNRTASGSPSAGQSYGWVMRNLFIVLGLGVFGAIGCNTVADVTNKQSDAVNAAVTATCDRYEACDKIGAGKTYETSEACENDSRDFWNGQWTVAECEGHINGDALDVCTDRISSTACDSFVDKLSTVYVSCSSDDVCK
jgi:hypothetical protein